jgi:hypothetical protein
MVGYVYVKSVIKNFMRMKKIEIIDKKIEIKLHTNEGDVLICAEMDDENAKYFTELLNKLELHETGI